MAPVWVAVLAGLVAALLVGGLCWWVLQGVKNTKGRDAE